MYKIKETVSHGVHDFTVYKDDEPILCIKKKHDIFYGCDEIIKILKEYYQKI